MTRLLIILVFLATSTIVTAQTAWYYPSTTGELFNTWTNPTNGFADDGNRASLIYSSMPGSQDYGDFGIDYTSLAGSITGIELRGEIYNNNAPPSVTYMEIELSGDGGSTWVSNGHYVGINSNWVEDYWTIGNASDLWGGTWTSANFSDANFKVRLTFTADGSPYISELDYVQVRVYTGAATSDTIYFDPVVTGSTQVGTQANPITSGSNLVTAIQGADPGTVIMMADTTFYGSLAITGAAGSSINPIKITTWHKYTTTRKFKLSGYKTVTGFTQVGNNWRLTDTDLPNSYRSSAGDDYTNYILLRNYLKINGVNYAVSRYPNTGYRRAENWDVASSPTYLYDNEALNDNYDGALMIFTREEWGLSRVKLNASGNYLYFQSGYSSVDLDTLYTYNTGSGKYPYYALANLEYLNDANGDHAYNPETQQLSVYWTGSSLNSQKVEYSTFNYLLRLDNCSYIDIDGISFDGGSVAQVYFKGSSNIRILNNRFTNCPGWAGILGGSGSNNPIITGNYMTDGVNNGVNVRDCSNPSVYGNVILRMGVSDVMMSDQLDGQPNSINIRNTTGVHTVNNNIFDYVGFSGISVRPVTGTTSIDINQNVALNGMLNLNDGALIYVFEPQNLGAFHRSIKKNYVQTSTGNAALSYYQAPAAFGIYLDGGAEHWEIDSNVVIGANAGLNFNGTDQNTAAYNILYANNAREDRSAGIKAQYYGHFTPTTDCYFHHNTIIVRDSTTEHGVFWIWDGSTFNNYGTISNYNDFFTPFFTSSEHIGGTYNWASVTSRSRAGMNSVLGWENNSTWNKTGHDYQDVTGITRDQFVWIFYSDTTDHTFSLGTTVFKDVNGTNVSGSITLDAGESRVLFYSSGSLEGVDDPLYVNYDVGTIGGGGTGGGTYNPGTGKVRLFDDGIEQAPYDDGLLQYFNAK